MQGNNGKITCFCLGLLIQGFKIFPQGSPVENGTLSSASFPFHWPEENLGGTHEWNKKHQVKVYVFRFLGNFDVGFSGAPGFVMKVTITL